MRWASVKGKVESMEGSSPKAERKFSSQDVVKFLIQNKAAVLLLILCVVLSFVSPYFLTAKNLINVVRQASVLAIMGIGFTLLLSSGSMDLSVGDLMAMTGVVIAILDAKIGVHPVLCMLAGVLVSVTGLCLNTFLVQTFKLPGFILTLATGMVYQGILWLISGGQSISGISDTLKFIGQGEIFRIPVQIYLLAVILIFMTVLLRRTEFGRHSLAMGGNLDSARVCGINITRNKYIIAVIMGACTAVAAMVTAGRLRPADGRLRDGYGYHCGCRHRRHPDGGRHRERAGHPGGLPADPGDLQWPEPAGCKLQLAQGGKRGHHRCGNHSGCPGDQDSQPLSDEEQGGMN